MRTPFLRRISRFGVALPAIVLVSCNEPCPHYAPTCADDVTVIPEPRITADMEPARYNASVEAPSSVDLVASTGTISRFLGTDGFKLVVASGKRLYLLLPSTDTGSPPVSYRMDRGDEGPNGNVGWPNEPLFSPDGQWLAYAGDFKTKTSSYVREAVSGTGWRIPVIRAEGPLAHPHWHGEGSDTWLYLSDVALTTAWNSATKTNNGNTWRTRFLDTAVGALEAATLGGRSFPGAFKGGISRDGKWAGTSYQQSVLFNSGDGSTTLLQGGIQQCNPSMNPFESGSNTDFMMILGFGGAELVPTADGSVQESQHENLWIWSKDDRAVWRARLPNVAPFPSDEIPGTSYYEWQRPEWSTHPDFATAFAKRTGTADGVGYDLLIVKLGPVGGELASHDRRSTLERGPVLRIATGSFISSDWSHLWVRP